MCGIIGEISQNIDLKKFIEMRDTLIHRGPDDEGVYINKTETVALGHRRLSIIDLSSRGKQPMKNEDGTIWITYNGEIYNFQEIRNELINLNHTFYSKTDTEVIIHGYEEWGLKIIDKLNGMFAFGIWDERNEQLVLTRDRIGIKPLYYYYNNERFIFASELKAIIKDETIERKINPEALKNFFINAYIPSPYSIWENIYKLPPAHYLIYKNKTIQIKRYWRLELNNKYKKEKEVLNQIRKKLMDSIEYRFISDVPVGTLLSGGMDSSIITALGTKIKRNLNTFSIGFKPEKFSELSYAKYVAKYYNVQNISDVLSSKNINNQLDKILYYYDEPFGISSMFPTFLLMENIHKYNLKVVLSGSGADEIFAGYNWYVRYMSYLKYRPYLSVFKLLKYLTSYLKKYLDNRIINKIDKLAGDLLMDELSLYNCISNIYFNLNELKHFFRKDYYEAINNDNFLTKYVKGRLDNIKKLQYIDVHSFLVDNILVKDDRAGMAYSIEVRVPFLDHNLIEYVMSINPNLIFRKKIKKYLLKKIGEKLLPSVIINKKKQGFSAPIDRLGFLEQNMHVLDDPYTVRDGILRKDYIDKIKKSKERVVRLRKVFLLIYFELWYRKWRVCNS